MRRPCLDCGKLTSQGSRCDDHERQHQSERWASRTHYHGDWRRISVAARRAHPFCSVSGCTSTDLTFDHDGLGVLCRHHHGRIQGGKRIIKETRDAHAIRGTDPVGTGRAIATTADIPTFA